MRADSLGCMDKKQGAPLLAALPTFLCQGAGPLAPLRGGRPSRIKLLAGDCVRSAQLLAGVMVKEESTPCHQMVVTRAW